MIKLLHESDVLREVTSVCHYRWSLRLLVALGRGEANRFCVFERRLGINPQSLSKHLAHLIQLGWVEKNEGYGHPLRPDYILTARGRMVATAAIPCWELIERKRLEEVMKAKWSIPAMTGLALHPHSFVSLRSALRTTSRSLSGVLANLERHGMLIRTSRKAWPPVQSVSWIQIDDIHQGIVPRLPPFALSKKAAPLGVACLELARVVA